MTNLEIDRALALAIGWQPKQVVEVHRAGARFLEVKARRFNHRDPSVIWPIAERFHCFPHHTIYGDWYAEIRRPDEHGCWSTISEAHADCAATAVALAVIEAHK